MKNHIFKQSALLLLLIFGQALCAQNPLLENKMRYNRDTLLLSQAGTGFAALLRTLAEIQGLKSEHNLLKYRTTIKKLNEHAVKEKMSPKRLKRLLQRVTHGEKVTSSNIDRIRMAADLFAIVEDVAAPRSNWAETIAGAGSTLSAIKARNDKRIGKNLWLRGALSVFDSALGAARNIWYRSPQQLKWLTVGHAATRLAKMLAQHGIKNTNKRAFLAYLLQAVRGVLGFVGGPRENQLKHVDLHDNGHLVPAALSYSEQAVLPGIDSYYFDDNGKVRDKDENVVQGFDFLNNFANQEQFEEFVDSLEKSRFHKKRCKVTKRIYSQRWDIIQKKRQLADRKQDARERGLPVYFDMSGTLRNRTTGEPVNWQEYTVWAPGKQEPHWFALAAHAVIADKDSSAIVSGDNAWQEQRKLYEMARERGYPHYFDYLGVLRLTDDEATPLVPNADGTYNILLPRADSTGADEPAWDDIVQPVNSKIRLVRYRIKKVIGAGKKAWKAHFYDKRIALLASDRGWHYYFAADGSLMNTQAAELVSRNEGSYSALARVPGRDEPNWEHLAAAAACIPSEEVKESVGRILGQHQRVWRTPVEDPLRGVRFAPDGTLRFDNGAGPQAPDLRPQVETNGELVGELAAENSYWNSIAEIVPVLHPVLGAPVPMSLYRVADCLSPFTYGVSQEPNWAALRAEANRVVPHGYANMTAYNWIGAYEALWARYKERNQEQAAAAEEARAGALARERAAAATAVITDLSLPVGAACCICCDDVFTLDQVARNSNKECSCAEALFCQDCAVRTRQETKACPVCRKVFTGIAYYRPVPNMDLS